MAIDTRQRGASADRWRVAIWKGDPPYEFLGWVNYQVAYSDLFHAGYEWLMEGYRVELREGWKLVAIDPITGKVAREASVVYDD